MHWVEVRRWQDYKVPGSVNQVRIEALVCFVLAPARGANDNLTKQSTTFKLGPTIPLCARC